MFSHQRDASKIALACLTQRLKQQDFKLIDAQVTSAHLLSLGAREIDRATFSSQLAQYCHMENTVDLWQTEAMPVKDYIHP